MPLQSHQSAFSASEFLKHTQRYLSISLKCICVCAALLTQRVLLPLSARAGGCNVFAPPGPKKHNMRSIFTTQVWRFDAFSSWDARPCLIAFDAFWRSPRWPKKQKYDCACYLLKAPRLNQLVAESRDLECVPHIVHVLSECISRCTGAICTGRSSERAETEIKMRRPATGAACALNIKSHKATFLN